MRRATDVGALLAGLCVALAAGVATADVQDAVSGLGVDQSGLLAQQSHTARRELFSAWNAVSSRDEMLARTMAQMAELQERVNAQRVIIREMADRMKDPGR